MKKGLSVVLLTVLLIGLFAVSALADKTGTPGLLYNVDKTQVRLDENGVGELTITVLAGDNNYSAVMIDFLFEGDVKVTSKSPSGFGSQGPKRLPGAGSDPDAWYYDIHDTSSRNQISGDVTVTFELTYTGASDETSLTFTEVSRSTMVNDGTTNLFYNITPKTITILTHDAPEPSNGGDDDGDDDEDAVKYDVNVDDAIDNGTITASRSTAAEGATVTLTASPDSGYVLDDWEVRKGSSSGSTVSVTTSTSTRATFTMPADDVYVTATFKEGTDSSGSGNSSSGNSNSGNTNTITTPLSQVDILDSGTPLTAVNFADVPSSNWAYEYVEYLARRGFATGKTATTFAPNDPITRAEFITILARMSGDTLPSYEGTFTDVATGAYYAQPVAWGVQAGITTGTSATTFTPNRQITRQEIAAMILRYATFKNFTLPQTVATVTFTDQAQISDFAKSAVSAMQQAEIIGGYANGSFGPLNNATRAEAAKMLALTHYAMNR